MNKAYIIPVQKKCNCNCTFCISESREYDKNSEILPYNAVYYQRLLDIKQLGVSKIEITGGGEPFLNSKLTQIINAIKEVNPNAYLKLYTNANILRPIPDIDELNVSIVHYDLLTNQKFMRCIHPITLEEKCSYFRKLLPNARIRLSIPLIKDAIDSPEELEQMINLTSNYICEYVVRTLYPNTPNKKTLEIDFDFQHPKVVFEKNNDVKEFEGCILWSDNQLYRNWQLEPLVRKRVPK